MGRKRKRAQQKAPTTTELVWLKAEIHFGTTFSYRQPDASAQFAVGSPVPSPAAIKLALVDIAIRWRGDVNYGKQVFEWLKTCPVRPVPPKRVVRFRVFLKRLKPREGKLHESTGIRDYFLLDGPLTVFLQVPQSKAEEAKELLLKLRKLGTSDSLCYCTKTDKTSQIPEELFPRKLDKLHIHTLQQGLTKGLLIVRLSDLTEQAQFEDFNPFGGRTRRKALEKTAYMLPLRFETYGETWAIFSRAPIREQNAKLGG